LNKWVWTYSEHTNEVATKNEELRYAINTHDLEGVKKCLENEADPNYFESYGRNDDVYQPTTPLLLIMFRISDDLLHENDIKQFGEIAKILLQYNADPQPAMKIAERRYGEYDPTKDGERPKDKVFMDVWHIVATGKKMDPKLQNEIKMAYIERESRPNGELYQTAKQSFYNLVNKL
jgi:hypothetical protein